MSLAAFLSPEARKTYLALYRSMLTAYPVPYEERYVTTTAGRTHVIVSGPESAPPLLLLHGFMATNLMWESHIALLSQHYRCYSVQTVTDVGLSEQTSPVRNVLDYVTWLREVFAGLGLARARVMGLSYGGWLATALALHAPELVEKAVLLCPAGGLAPLTPQFILRAIPGMLTKSRALLRWYWAWFFHDKRKVDHPATDLFVNAWITFRQPREFVQPTVFTDEELRSIQVETTLLIGEQEVIYKNGPKAALQRAQALIPGVRTHLVPAAGHVLTLDNPDETGRLMLEGLA
jgi:pimeloyl-ACP methyl ester carboxylesterase